MKKIFERYSWLFEWIGAAALIALAITVVVTQQILLYVIGITFVVFGLFRIVPLVKTTNDKLVKWLVIIEMVIDVVAGGVLIFFATQDKDLQKYFGYIVGAVLYFRGFVHFLSTSLRNEPTTFLPFLFNVAFITLGTAIFIKDGFSLELLAWIIFVLSLLSAGVIVFRGYGSYKKYRYNLAINRQTQVVVPSDTVEAPTSDQIIVNIPVPEEKDSDVAEL